MSSPPDSFPEPSGTPRIILTFLRWFFRHLYTTLAWAYDAVAWLSSLGQWSVWRRTALDFVPPGSTFLELGYGTGHLLVEGQRRGLHPIGVDASAQMARIASRRLRRLGLRQVAARAVAGALPLAGGLFQTAVATFPSEYIFQPAALSEIHRVLAPGGSLVVAISAPIRPRFIWERFAGWLYELTGQAPNPEARLLAPFRTAGFAARYQTVEVPGASVHYLIAEVPDIPASKTNTQPM